MKMLDFARRKAQRARAPGAERAEHQHPRHSALHPHGLEADTSGTELEFTPEQYPAVVKKCALVWMRYEGGAQK